MPSDTVVFDPSAITESFRKDVPNSLRMLAEAIDAGMLEATFHGSMPFDRHYTDPRIHLRVMVDVAAPALQRRPA